MGSGVRGGHRRHTGSLAARPGVEDSGTNCATRSSAASHLIERGCR
jgi:hypothetical protein